jgi:hypothetical protein
MSLLFRVILIGKSVILIDPTASVMMASGDPTSIGIDWHHLECWKPLMIWQSIVIFKIFIYEDS